MTIPGERLDSAVAEAVAGSRDALREVVETIRPIVVRYVLPEPGMRFLARAVLPRKDRGWGDLEIVVRDGARELLRSRLDAQHPAVAIDLPISGTDLTIELLEGRNGPVQDTVLLLRPLLIPNRQA